MAELTFDDLIPAQKKAGSGGLSFDDLVPQAQPREQLPAVTRGEAFGRGLSQGAMFGLADEAAALRRADPSAQPLQPPADPANMSENERLFRSMRGNGDRGIMGAARGAFGLITGNPEAQKRYDAALADERTRLKAAEQQFPGTMLAGNVVGGLAIPLPAVQGWKSGAAVGAGAGAAYGFGSGEGLGDRAERALTGGVLGGLFGAAVPTVVNAVSGAASGARTAAGPAIGAFSPEREAARRIQRALEMDARSGSAGLSRAEMEAMAAQGVPVAVADMGGDATRGLARAATNVSPEAKSALDAVTNPRFASQTDRVGDIVGRTSTLGANATDTLEALRTAAQKTNASKYNAAYAQGEAGVWNEGLGALLEAPAVQDALRKTLKNAGNRSVVEGGRPIRSPFALDGDTIVLARQKDGSIASPNLQFWDDIKRHLDDAYKSANRSGQANLANDVLALKRQLTDNLDAAIPAYKQARQGAAAAFGAEDALEAGQKFLTASGENAQYAKAIGKMSPPERALFQEGFASALRGKIAEIGDRRTVLDKIANSPAARQRIEMALGKENAGKLLEQLRIEGVMDKLRVATQGNSTTTSQLIQLGLVAAPAGAGGGLGWLVGGDSQSAMAGAMAGGLMRWGKGRVDERVARKVGEMLASNDPKVIDRALAMVAKSQSLQKTIRDFDAALVKAGIAPFAAPAAEKGASFLSGMNPSRADSQQEKQN